MFYVCIRFRRSRQSVGRKSWETLIRQTKRALAYVYEWVFVLSERFLLCIDHARTLVILCTLYIRGCIARQWQIGFTCPNPSEHRNDTNNPQTKQNTSLLFFAHLLSLLSLSLYCMLLFAVNAWIPRVSLEAPYWFQYSLFLFFRLLLVVCTMVLASIS